MASAPDWLREAAVTFAHAAPVPNGAGARAPMRDLKGWLARLLAEDVLPRWVDAAAVLCASSENPAERLAFAEMFTRLVLKTVSDRDNTRTQSVDTTLRRHCSTDPKKGLTFMKLLNAMCAAFDFSGSTSRCCKESARLVSFSQAERWRTRFDQLVFSLHAIRLCVKNDDASHELIASITNRNWAKKFAKLLLAEHHRHCAVEPASLFSNGCSFMRGEGDEERRDLCQAITEAIRSSAPHAIARAPVMRCHFSTSNENHPLCAAALIVPYNPSLALTLADRAVGLGDRSCDTLKNSGIPFEIHRELRFFSVANTLANGKEGLVRIMIAFSPFFKCYKPPLRWWPTDRESDHLHELADNDHWVANTVTALMMEHIGRVQSTVEANVEALRRYEQSGHCGDVFGAIHAAKMLVSGCPGVPRDPRRAESFFEFAVRSNVREAISHLGDLYCGSGEPEVPRDEARAAQLYQVAVDQGCLRAAIKLAEMYEHGRGGLPKDSAKAEELRQAKYATAKPRGLRSEPVRADPSALLLPPPAKSEAQEVRRAELSTSPTPCKRRRSLPAEESVEIGS